MEFVQRPPGKPARVGILAGSFNPPTVAHFELLRAGIAEVDQIVCVLPKVFPHKEYFGATLPQRLHMLRAASSGLEQPLTIATSERGLFIDIVREYREQVSAGTRISLLCGADAAERIIEWDYGLLGSVEEMLEHFELLVAPRRSVYTPPPKLAHRIRPLSIRGEHHHVSSTEVRERIQRGEPWEHLVPPPIVDLVREIYS
jgi:nicotinate (nicotinamide) nucleotide adenylyltransferase